MKRRWRSWIAAAPVLLVVPLLATACGGANSEEEAESPAVVDQVKGSSAVRVVLTPDAAKRLDIRTATVRSDGDGHTIVPLDAVIYDPSGAAWTYTNPKPLVFQRADVTVAGIDGTSAVLAKGPAAGVQVVTTGATEIFGVEYGGIEEAPAGSGD